MGQHMEAEKISDGTALLILFFCVSASIYLSSLFWQRHKAHLIWTIPVGFVAAFVVSAIWGIMGEMVFNILGSIGGVGMLIATAYEIKKNKANPYEKLFRQPKNAALLDKFEQMPPPNPPPEPNIDFDEIKRQQEQLEKENKEKEQLIKKQQEEIKRLKQRTETPIQPIKAKPQNRSAKGMPETGSIVEFYYTNNKGEYGLRTVRISRCGREYLDGLDLDKGVSRTFRLAKIDNREVTDTETGEIFKV